MTTDRNALTAIVNECGQWLVRPHSARGGAMMRAPPFPLLLLPTVGAAPSYQTRWQFETHHGGLTTPEWFPCGKWATIQAIESQLHECVTKIVGELNP